MRLTIKHNNYLAELHHEYVKFKGGKEPLLKLLTETELPETVYNSNAIENSTLSLPETEKILLDQEVSRDLNLREVYEAKNLARLTTYIQNRANEHDLTLDLILLLHQMLIGVINDDIAGRFRHKGEYVRVGLHIAPAPEHIESMLTSALGAYYHDHETHFLHKIARFHLEFETIHPFNDGNGRVGRILINWQLARLGYPPIIIRNKGKEKYYNTFGKYRARKKEVSGMSTLLYLALTESLHKRLAYLRGNHIVTLAAQADHIGDSVQTLLNKARRQTIAAFRERGVWKIGVKSKL